MSEQSEKSIQELREEIKRLEDTVAQQREIIKARGEELARLNLEKIDALTRQLTGVCKERDAYRERQRQTSQQITQCIIAIMGYDPVLSCPEGFLPEVTKKYKELSAQLQRELQSRPPSREHEIEALKKERDANMMRALDAERDLRNERFRSEAFKKRVEDLESPQLQSQEMQALRAEVERQAKRMAEMTQQYTRAEYELRDTRKEFDDLKQKYIGLRAAEDNRKWATTDKNCYNDFLALRDMILPAVPLGDFRVALLRFVESLRKNAQLEKQNAEGLQKELGTAQAEWKHERFLKEEIYKFYGELRKLFNLEHIASSTPQQVHSSIVHMLTVKTNAIQELDAQLEKERALACETIRALEAMVQKPASEGQ